MEEYDWSKRTIVIDFDGTIVTNKYPEIGDVKRWAPEVINGWYDEGHYILINTCRADEDIPKVETALERAGISYHEINNNHPARIKAFGGDCRKLSGDIYIDDLNAPYMFMSWGNLERIVDSIIHMKPLIICIMGESGVGKSEVAKYIEREYNVPMIRSYTDKVRTDLRDDTHTYLSKYEFNQLKKEDMIAHTEFGGNRYCCLKSDIHPKWNTYVIDEEGYKMLYDKYKYDYNIHLIYIERPYALRALSGVSEERMKRDAKRNFYYIEHVRKSHRNVHEIKNHGRESLLYDDVDEIMCEIKIH